MIGTDPVLVDHLVRVFDAVHLLHAVPAAEMHDAATDHAVAADIDVLVDHDDRGAVLERRDGRGETGYARADRDEVGGVVPGSFFLGVG